MRFLGSESRRVSPYLPEITQAQCVRRLANMVSLLQVSVGDDFDFDAPDMQELLADVASVREEYDASPDDMQLALQANDRQLIIGAMESYE